jgi:hypothetical protein
VKIALKTDNLLAQETIGCEVRRFFTRDVVTALQLSIRTGPRPDMFRKRGAAGNGKGLLLVG